MANLRKWTGGWTSRSTVLTTELNALANNAFSAVGTTYDNTTNGNQIGWLEVNLASLNPTGGAYVRAFNVQALDGTNFENAPSATNPGFGLQNLSSSVPTGSATKKVTIGPFLLPPGKSAFVLQNNTNVALGATSNTVTLYTTDETNNG